MTISEIQETLDKRRATHGDFKIHAEVTQELKLNLRLFIEREHVELTSTQAEAIDMILHKIGRIIAGDPNHHDHWHDIAGYATLVADELSTP